MGCDLPKTRYLYLMGSKPHKLTDQRYFRKFRQDRNRALEVLLRNTQKRIAKLLDGWLADFDYNLLSLLPRVPQGDTMGLVGQSLIHRLDDRMNTITSHVAPQMAMEIVRLRRKTYLLTKAAETQAIAGALSKKLTVKALAAHSHDLTKPTPEMGNLLPRVKLALDRVKSKLMDTIKLGLVMGEPATEIHFRFKSKLPGKLKYKRPPKILKKVREASKPLNPLNSDDAPEALEDAGPLTDLQFLDPNEIQQIIEEIRNPVLTELRSPDSVFDVEVGEPELEEWYGWELEQSLTHDFVSSVRDGENEAASDAGIEDFVWVAIIDDKTDDCCLWRDGLLVSEIEKELNGKHADDDCDATEPPAHFNCRCELSPALENLPDKPASNQPEFDEWLNQSQDQ